MLGEQLISFDYAMKYILRDKSDYSIIEGFLSALLATAGYKPVKVKALLETESNKDEKRGKRILADMVVEDTDGVQYIIEIERNEKYNFMHKACFSSSRVIVDSIGQGQDYLKIVKVIHISLLYFDIGGSSLYHGKTIVRDVNSSERLNLHLKRENGSTYDVTDILPEYFLISIPAFHDEIHRSIDEWLYMMKHEAIKDDFKEKYIKLAAERLNFLKMTLEEQANYMRYKLEMIDVREEFHTQFIKGKAEGKAEGKLEMAKAMLLKGIPADVVASISGLSQETLTKLASKN
ncbi:MAG: hypothetical protein K0R14_2222 [Burkholderiales bacterium]|jgi:predicted transposase/invertase (TIGR01784 family)|nr:hypothetical protein [Burkholderiales bacterium]